ncbi:MAG: metallophosphoesterase [Ekhidna sp.]
MKHLIVVLFLFPALLFGQKIFLIGDAGEPKNPDKNLNFLVKKTEGASSEDVLIFLGDNLYPKGLPDREDPLRIEMENKLIPQLEVMKKFPGKVFMIPGNHDWAQGRSYGWERSKNMDDFIAEYFENDEVFLPGGSCPGPSEIPINENATLIIVNSQYFLHGWDKPGEDEACRNKGSLEALEDLRNIVEANEGKHIVLAAHHPVYTYGEHHGNFGWKDHLFPLTSLNDKFYIPLPFLGSIHPLFRKTIGNIQDNTNLKYKAIMNQIVNAMNEANNVIHVAGHEHSLQLIEQKGHHFIVSGSGSKTTFIKKGKGSLFAKSEQGFAELNLLPSGESKVKFWGVENGLLYEKSLYKKELIERKSNNRALDFSDSTVLTVASEQYVAGKRKKVWLGENYRDVWSTPVEVDVFDISKEKGGLKILKKGGGQQTKSLRLEANDGKQYVLRSIEKYPAKAIPVALQKTFAEDVVQDQISSSHPYGAFVIPTLADAAQIYHTNPKPVWIPDDPLLGQFQSVFAGTLAVFEERPTKESASEPFFGGAKDVEGTFDVLDKLQIDNDNIVDQNFVVRNRLFDMWIGDWDRHDDQWRWAEFDKKGKGKMYRPIPRDRDQVFFVNDGIIPKIAARKWAIPKVEGFDEKVDWAPGLSQNARFFDRTFMNEPSWDEWQEQIDFLQNNLTDVVIEKAISEWPDQVQRKGGQSIIDNLKIRRADMERYARELYLFLSKEVEVLGSDKHEYFLIDQLSENETLITVTKRKKEGNLEQVIYERLFTSEETTEVRLYGRDGEDVFEIKGNTSSNIKIRIIGGTDKDLIINGNGVERLKNVEVYDRKKSTKIEGNSKGMMHLSEESSINEYDRKAFKFDRLMPLLSVNLNPDDGLFFGGGFSYVKHAWRKLPFASKHTLTANGALATGSFNVEYEGVFTDVLGKWDVKPAIIWQEPFFVNNFFGLGNESQFLKDQSIAPDDDAIDFYRTRMDRFQLDVDLVKNLGTKGQFYVGSGFRTVEIKNTANRFISSLPDQDFSTNRYFTSKVGVSMDSRNSKVMPTSGMTAFAELENLEALESNAKSTTQWRAEWAFFLSVKVPSRLVIANRFGFGHNTSNEFDFFNANTLGGRSNLRGTRRTRFYGQTSFYHNIDLRLKLFSFRSYIFPGQFGILAFHDTGRVWLDGESSDKWHTGKGFGLWVSPLNTIVLNVNYAFGEDENLPTVSLGFFF